MMAGDRLKFHLRPIMTARRLPVVVMVIVLPGALLLPGCQSVMTSSSGSLVRVIDASSNAPALDVYAGSDLIATNVGAPVISNYALIASSTLRTVDVDAHGTKTVGAQTTGSFPGNEEHSIFITDTGAGYQAAVLTDQSIPAPSGQIAVRFLQNASSSGALDIYFVPDGSAVADAKPVATALAPGTITAYILIPVGTYDLIVVPTGTTTARFTGKAVTYTTGQVRTALIVDEPVTSNPPIGVVVGDDLL